MWSNLEPNYRREVLIDDHFAKEEDKDINNIEVESSVVEQGGLIFSYQ